MKRNFIHAHKDIASFLCTNKEYTAKICFFSSRVNSTLKG